ncbi:MAG: anaerobic ribonucleoside-triphosphate reductase activating protein [Lachnospiraceae bacterium]|nr:anaerobic ribonucleoside-triphosphate reductase activating protein [Lachnospiraceae bacterium]
MNVGQIFRADIANGPGVRESVFVSGCRNHCPGCFNEETWDFAYGTPYTEEMEDEILRELAEPYYDGLSLLGGEPFEPENQETVLQLVKRVRRELPQRSIWAYTGCIYERDFFGDGRCVTPFIEELLDNIDVLVDGPFLKSEKDITLTFRGSSNQRIIDLKNTRKSGKPVLLDF